MIIRSRLLPATLISALLLFLGLNYSIIGHFPELRRPVASSDIPPSLNTRVKPLVNRFILVLIDALRSDTAYNSEYMPHLNRYKSEGAWGIAFNPNLSLTNLAVINIATGATPRITRVLQNFKNDPAEDLSLFEILSTQGKSIGLVGDACWSDLFGAFSTWSLSIPDRGIDDLYDSDRKSLAMARHIITTQSYDFLVVHTLGADHAGHKFTPPAPEYKDMIQHQDRIIHEIRQLDSEATMLIIADHGMTDQGTHGGGETEVAYVPFVFHGPGIRQGANLKAVLDDFAPTILALHGIPWLGSSRGKILEQIIKSDRQSLDTLLSIYHQSQREYQEYAASTTSNSPTLFRWLGYSLMFISILICLMLLFEGNSSPNSKLLIGMITCLGLAALLSLFKLDYISFGLALMVSLAFMISIRRWVEPTRPLILFAVVCPVVVVLLALLYPLFVRSHNIIGWVTYSSIIDEWLLLRIHLIFIVILLVATLLFILKKPVYGLIMLFILLSVFGVLSGLYWQGNNQIRIGIMVCIALTALFINLRKQPGAYWLIISMGIFLVTIGLARWADRAAWLFTHTHPVLFGLTILPFLAMLALVVYRMIISFRTLLLVGLLIILWGLALAQRLFVSDILALVVLLGGPCLFILAVALSGRKKTALYNLLLYLIIFRVLADDRQMLILSLFILGVLLFFWGIDSVKTLVQAALSGITVFALGLLCFFLLGHGWNFSLIEVPVAFVGTSGSLFVPWAIFTITLKHALPWLLLCSLLMRHPQSQSMGMGMWITGCAQLFGVVAPFAQLSNHIEYGTKALAQGVILSVHLGIIMVGFWISRGLMAGSYPVSREGLSTGNAPLSKPEIPSSAGV